MPTKSMRLLHEISPDEIQNYGGKAANLSILQRNGFTVPRGFAISGVYYHQMIQSIPEAKELMIKLDESQDFEEILELAANLQAVFIPSKLPNGMILELQEMFSTLQNRTHAKYGYAVRSSASIEDGRSFSFAGQADTYLCVKEIEDVLISVKNVWQSAISPQSAIYLKTKDIPMSSIRMGVVIQEMIDAVISGVLFTANVIDSRMDHMLIEATWGLGEALVGGKVVPDTYVVDRETMTSISRTLGSKESTFIQGNGCTLCVETPLTKREAFVLSDEILRDLIELGIEIEEKMGCPQDIEWCVGDGEIVVLQSRPITTLR
ncbi:MAG: PEP/pyruvate-binding domain-containing protein [Candidatus Thorarchaeota archaeon]